MNAEQTVLLRKAADGLGAARVLIEAGYYGVEDTSDISIARRHIERAETFLERMSSLLGNDRGYDDILAGRE